MSVTYDDVASTLSRDVVETIEVSAPCLKSANREHMWDSARSGWRCVYCDASTRTAPVPPVADPWPPIPWDD